MTVPTSRSAFFFKEQPDGDTLQSEMPSFYCEKQILFTNKSNNIGLFALY